MKKVMVTRPRGQQKEIHMLLKEAGYQPLAFPLIDIRPIELDATDKHFILNLDQFNGIVVVSPNAAHLGMQMIETYWPQLPAQQIWVTNGEATQAALAAHGVNARIPASGTASEDLLKMPELNNIEGQNWLIIRGEGGRELLSESLVERGAQVTKLAVYQRRCPAYQESDIEKAIKWCEIIFVTSAEALDNLDMLAGHLDVWSKTLVVSSMRLLQLAKNKGWAHPILAAGAGNRQMVAALSKL